VERTLYAEGEILVCAIEPQIRGEQSLFRDIHGVAAPSKVEEEPLEVQAGHEVGHVDAEKSLRNEGLRHRKRKALVAAESREAKHGEVFALDETNTDGGLTRTLPGHTGFGIDPFGNVDQFWQVVLVSRINRSLLLRLEGLRVFVKIWCAPLRGRSGSDLSAQPLGRLALSST